MAPRIRHASANFSLKSQVLDDTAPVIARSTVRHVRPRARVAIWIRVFYMFHAQLRLRIARIRAYIIRGAAGVSLARLVSPHQRPTLCRRAGNIRAQLTV